MIYQQNKMVWVWWTV